MYQQEMIMRFCDEIALKHSILIVLCTRKKTHACVSVTQMRAILLVLWSVYPLVQGIRKLRIFIRDMMD